MGSRRHPVGVAGARACPGCLRRAWLLGALSGHLDRIRPRLGQVLALGDEELLAALGGRRRRRLEGELAHFDAGAVRSCAAEAGVGLICRCDPEYPRRLACLESAPAVLHVAGGVQRFLTLAAADPVAIVGTRRASPYGLDVARSLGRGLASAGLTVVSGMALGIDSAAHRGALSVDGPTIAVLPAGADRSCARRTLFRRLEVGGAAVSELPPGVSVRRWMFPARNRIIAALAAMTVVVEAGERSGALITARFARELERPVAAVPGRISSPGAAGPNELLARGARLVRGPQDVLDAVFGSGARTASPDPRPELDPELGRVLSAIASGRDTPGLLGRGGFTAERALAAIAALELAGYVRREPGGRFAVVP